MLNIAGGTYLENCVFPVWDEVYGSGLRASIAIANLTDVIFHTYSGGKIKNHIGGICSLHDISLKNYSTDNTISFHYLHGLSDPYIHPPIGQITPSKSITIKGENILRFGMLEGDAVIEGERVVYDPQSPNEPIPFYKNGSKAEELALVLNSTEAKKLSGSFDIQLASKKLLEDAQIVIIKEGSKGAQLYTKSNTKTIPAFETESVWALGTGDVFSALFAVFWADLREDPYQAALKASKAVAFYCETQQLPIPEDIFKPKGFKPNQLITNSKKKKRNKKYDVYLASPFFSLSEYWLLNETKNCLEESNLKVFSPFHDVGKGNSSEITDADLEGLNNSELVFAIADGKDVGTIFEIGYARSKDIPVIIYSTLDLNHNSTMLEGTGCQIYQDFTTAIYKTVWEVTTK